MWTEVVKLAKEWCEEVKAPDLWSELQRAKELLTAAQQESENTPFAPEEKEEISREIRKIKEYVKTAYALSSEQMSRIEAGLDEAERASRRLGRKDWLLLFSGTILTLILTDFVTPDIAQHIFVMALHGLGHLFGTSHGPVRKLPQ